MPLLAQKNAPPAAPRPNVVLVVADDLAAWMLGCYGNQEIRTPNIDRLAAAGTRFTNSFVCTPICSASRATLFTGRTPMQHGIQDFLTERPATNPDQGQTAPPPGFANETMISDLLAGAGYNCGYIGKWHMGNDAKPGHGYSYTATMGARSYVDPTLSVNGSPVQERGYLADILTRHAVQFLDQQKQDKPFFLTVSHLNPHVPYDGHPQKYYDLYKDTRFASFGIQPGAPNALREKEYLNDSVANIRRCAAATTALDDQIPALQKKLIEKGFFENTIFIFTGDNGFLLGRHGLWSKGHASNPINMYDEVMQVPMIWSWPGFVPTHTIRPEMVSFYDFLPSVCEATGQKPPAAGNLCGRSYLPILTNKPLPKKQPWRQLVFGHFRNTEMARDNYFKVVIRNGGKGPNELFDLRKDPREMVNLYDNPGFNTVRDRLAGELAAWREKHS
ncbi:MAG: sulfatase-like hydrolase/transferase [Acidobacteria bacterium]|nr:sulfatase-like hydrolase/transferase [Acidobacteriota bacterium]